MKAIDKKTLDDQGGNQLTANQQPLSAEAEAKVPDVFLARSVMDGWIELIQKTIEDNNAIMQQVESSCRLMIERLIRIEAKLDTILSWEKAETFENPN